jgi:hypothetical protein
MTGDVLIAHHLMQHPERVVSEVLAPRTVHAERVGLSLLQYGAKLASDSAHR